MNGTESENSRKEGKGGVRTVAGRSFQLERPGAKARWLLAGGVTLVFLGLGLVGVYRYVQTYWLYRGFAPPRAASFVREAGTQESFDLRSRALGGRRQQVVVYLPPGYHEHPRRRYPVLYLLHGVPGRPIDLLRAGEVGVWADTLYAERLTAGVILVMPSGSTGLLDDTEWANGIRPGHAYETFVARDVVQAVDERYRTVRSPQARAIGGLSEGGYGALNIALHHPREFQVVESWSGYVRADNIPALFGRQPALLAYNSPIDYLPRVAATLRRRHVYFWFYCGNADPLQSQNAAFAAELARYHIEHRFFIGKGGHSWPIWRANAREALLVAVTRLTAGR